LNQAKAGDAVEVLLPETCFYVESGGQLADTGTIKSLAEPGWEIRVEDMRKPAAGVIVHSGPASNPAMPKLASCIQWRRE